MPQSTTSSMIHHFKAAIVSALLIVFIASACTSEPTRKSFLDNYADYCGYAYRGESTVVELGEGSPLDGADLVMIMDECTDGEVRMPFYVDDDRSRTWIMREVEGRLHLSHDHRNPDGSEQEANLYGGYADDEGDAETAYFPSDEETIAARPSREINRWSKSFDHENQRYYYRLYLRDTLRYEAAFDLSNPLPVEQFDVIEEEVNAISEEASD